MEAFADVALLSRLQFALTMAYHFLFVPLSIGLGLFNLLPIPPLDGSKVLGAFLPERTYFGLMRYERYGMLALILLSFTGVGSTVISWGIMAVYRGLFNLFY